MKTLDYSRGFQKPSVQLPKACGDFQSRGFLRMWPSKTRCCTSFELIAHCFSDINVYVMAL